MTQMKSKTRWLIMVLIISVCFNILAVVLLNISDRMRWGYADANYYLANHEFWGKAKDNEVLLYRISDAPDSEFNVDNWKIMQRSLNPRCKTKEDNRARMGLQNFVTHNRDAAIILAGHLLLNEDKNVGKRIIDEIAQIDPDYYFSRVKKPPIKIITLQEIGTTVLKGETPHKDLLEYLELQYEMILHPKYGFGRIAENNEISLSISNKDK